MMEGALSGKTGFTGNAGYCYVGSLERDGRTYVVALLACGWPSHKSYKWSDTKKLMDYGLKNYSARSLSEVQIQEEDLQPLRVLNAQTENLGEKAYVPVEIVRSEQAPVSVLMKESENFEIRTELTDTLTAPVETGTEVGTVSYLLDGEIYGVDYIVTAGAAEKIDYLYCLKQIIRQYGVF
jgi:D-alanyl-D-alanine carboxypeptidase (penicillin-binding protein 5/6)